MPDIEKAVTDYYEWQAQREWERITRHPTEFAVTFRALRDHLSPAPTRVLDCGGGPGRYAIELARWGYDVVLLDLTPGNLTLARQRALEAGVSLAGYEHGNAMDLGRFADESFDVVLLMGPLYHLLELAERQQAMQEARRVLRAGGPLFAAFITRYAPFIDAALKQPRWLTQAPELANAVFETGRMVPRTGDGQEFVAYFTHPDEVRPLCRGAGLEVRQVLAVEGIASGVEAQLNVLPEADFTAWVDLNYRLAADPCVHGAAAHLLAVAVKPAWRAVLRQVALGLEAASVRYKVVGGAAVALHSLPIPVKDIDIETDAAGAYRFQTLFAPQVLQPVNFSASDQYRSHFGRFAFGDVVVEVMGEIERREAGQWAPTAAQSETTVDLEGVLIRASTLEEETLAYIRRGRLERAAQCLPLCDPVRLRALM